MKFTVLMEDGNFLEIYNVDDVQESYREITDENGKVTGEVKEQLIFKSKEDDTVLYEYRTVKNNQILASRAKRIVIPYNKYVIIQGK